MSRINTILIVEDDSAINDLLAEILRRGGYSPVQAYSGTEARLLITQDTYSLILLDLMLPGLSGEQLLPLIRQRSESPVIVLSAKETLQDKINALHIGADDYMTKPFDEGELLARIEANLRRAGSVVSGKSILRFKELELDREARQAYAKGNPVTLTAREFDILELLMSNPSKVFTKSNIYHSVWNDEFLGDDNTVNVHISNIRSKLGGEYIQTVWGIGFKMQG